MNLVDGKQPFTVRINGTREGRTFEGIGGITSNGMSKLLMDYPEDRLREIMELLFKPDYGASLQHLKVEIGSDVNTSSGTEPSHMRSRDDFNIKRGCGLRLMKLAKEINPTLLLDALRWGTPRWIGNHEDKLSYYLNFLRGARDEYGLEFDYLGPDINEGAFDRDWTVNTLRPGLDREGFAAVKLVADDSDHGWEIADRAAADPELFAAVHSYGVHYRQDSTDTAKSSGKPLWLSEDLAPFRHSFTDGALHIGKRIIDMYVSGRMVKYELHPLVEAEYENTPFNYKGILVASWPWSGHYLIDPGLWVIAHFTQFAKPGWIYLDDGCALSDNGGYVTLKAPGKRGSEGGSPGGVGGSAAGDGDGDGDSGGTDSYSGNSDYSIIIVNTGAEPQTYLFEPEPGSGLALEAPLYVWRTNEAEHFMPEGALQPVNGCFELTVAPFSIYSLTTATGQRKGTRAEAAVSRGGAGASESTGKTSGKTGHPTRGPSDGPGAYGTRSLSEAPPAAISFPLPYRDDFGEGYEPGSSPKYTSDQGGAFEIDTVDGCLCLRQQITEATIPLDWTYRNTPQPYTLLGSLEWTNYRVSVDVCLEAAAGYVSVGGRVNYTAKSSEPPEGYLFVMHHDGRYELRKGLQPVAQGKTAAPGIRRWHRVELLLNGGSISAAWDGEPLLQVKDSDMPSGHISLGSSYHHAAFRQLAIEPVDAGTAVSCIRYDDRHPAIRYTGGWLPADGDYNNYARSLTKSNRAGDGAVIRFHGSAVSIIGKRTADSGLADIYLDGVYSGTVDNYHSGSPSTGYRKALISFTGLSAGEDDFHEIKLVVTGKKHPGAADAFIYIDAVEVSGGSGLR